MSFSNPFESCSLAATVCNPRTKPFSSTAVCCLKPKIDLPPFFNHLASQSTSFDQIPATARSNKIATVLGVQDFSQMIDWYGKEKAQAILSNLNNQFFGRTVNLSTAEMITRLFGKQDMTFKTKSVGNGTSGQFLHLNSNVSHSTGESIQERDRIKISDITNLEAGEFCGIISEGNPIEFVKMQLDPSYIEKSNMQLSNITSDEEIKINYLKIIEETKSIF